MQEPSIDRRLGDYILKEFLGEGPVTFSWLAEQASVHRDVLLSELRPELLGERDSFIADIRAKASVDHPLIGSVYEAVSVGEHCFFTSERLAGATLADRINAGAPFKPVRLAHILRRVAEANLHFESRNQASTPLDTADIHIDDHHGLVRLTNLAVTGKRDPSNSAEDIHTLGNSLPSLVADGHPGTTRVLTLLAWMRGEGGVDLGWQDVKNYADQIEQQLAEPSLSSLPTAHVVSKKRRIPRVAWMILAVVAVIGSAGGFLLYNLFNRPTPPPKAGKLPEPVEIAAGGHPTPDGTHENLRQFWLASHETTIGQYAEFLNTLKTLERSNRHHIYDHENQPANKTSHEPADWSEMIAAANSGGQWQGRAMQLDCPVVNVDWWDASAYCEWKHCSLPTQEEWFAAMRSQVPNPTTLLPSAWGPVTANTPDHTPNGLLGMAGSVSEWTRRPAPNPANPMGPRLWVIIGASFLHPQNGALAREWTEDRGLRRPDLGFRISFDHNPDK
jgi:hypothetical protein